MGTSRHGKPPKTTGRGYIKAIYLEDEQIEEILGHVESGLHITEACEQAGTSATQWRVRCNKDPDLRERYRQALEEEHKPMFQERLRGIFFWHIFQDKNYKAWRDAALMFLPEAEVLRTQRFEVANANGESLRLAAQQAFGDLTLEEIEARIKMLEADNVIELPARAIGDGTT